MSELTPLLDKIVKEWKSFNADPKATIPTRRLYHLMEELSQIIAPSPEPVESREEWNIKKHSRREDLADKEAEFGLTEEEMTELDELQSEMIEYHKTIAAEQILANKTTPRIEDIPIGRRELAAVFRDEAETFMYGGTGEPVRHALLGMAKQLDTPQRCEICNAHKVRCDKCQTEWCLDHQTNPLVCPGCGDRPGTALDPSKPEPENDGPPREREEGDGSC